MSNNVSPVNDKTGCVSKTPGNESQTTLYSIKPLERHLKYSNQTIEEWVVPTPFSFHYVVEKSQPPLETYFIKKVYNGPESNEFVCDTPKSLDEVDEKIFSDYCLTLEQALLRMEESEACVKLVQEIAKQEPEKPDTWSGCGQCERNIEAADEALGIEECPICGRTDEHSHTL